jgi:hypothetical protein
MPDRRSFLKSLGAAAVVGAVAPAVLAEAAQSGMAFLAVSFEAIDPLLTVSLDGSLWASNSAGNSEWSHKTPDEILADFNAALSRVWLESAHVRLDYLPFRYVGGKVSDFMEEGA